MSALDQKVMADILVHAYNSHRRQTPMYHVNKWLWRRFRRRFDALEEAAEFLFTDLRHAKRYMWLLDDDRFLRMVFGRRGQEMRPNRYPSRYFGVGYMNVQKVLRHKNRQIIERWQYHKPLMQQRVNMFEYLEKFLLQEQLVAAIDAGRPTEYLEQLYLRVYDNFNFDAPDTVSKNSNTILIKPDGSPRLT